MRLALSLLALLATTSVSAVGAADPPRVIRDGANHRLGDDSFVARFGRAPTETDGEPLRMRVHLEHVRDLLAARPPTAPELAGRRAELLGYLGDYLAKGITPENTYVPWRNPVFIDADGRICAVGYLIERSVGRALPEQIAEAHRLAYLEDITAAMPEVAGWVAASGFSTEELASIQPGYEGPEVQFMSGWDLATVTNGKFREEKEGAVLVGEFRRKQMTGAWKWTTTEGELLGTGTFHAGAGTWKSLRADGTKLAEGPFVRSVPEGEWRFFHASGRLAAVGSMRRGKRDGLWTFFHDAKGSPRLSAGRFENGETAGDWEHYDGSGKLVARATGHPWGEIGLTLSAEPGGSGVRHTITQGEPANNHRVDGFFLGGAKLYIVDRSEMFDDKGSRLDRLDSGWTAQPCTASKPRKRALAAGDVWTLYKLTGHFRSGERDEAAPQCSGAPVPVAAAVGKRYDAMLASRTSAHAPIPTWKFTHGAPQEIAADPASKEPAAPEDPAADDEAQADASAGPDLAYENPDDMVTYLAQYMTWYMEWPHIDGSFLAVYHSLPGYGRSAN